MDIEGKGFVIKDKRSFDEKGDLKDEKPEGERAETKEPRQQETRQEQKPGEKTESPPLPEVNLNTLIFSLSSSALLHLGEIQDPQTGQKQKDLELAKHTIDTISMLNEKTQGNLTDEEKKFMESVLTDLRWRFVRAKG